MLRLLFGAAARRVLAESRDLKTVARVWRRTCALHGGADGRDAMRAGGAPRSPGVALLLRVLAWDHALYAALRETDGDAASAAGVVERVNWTLARPGAVLAYRVAALAGGDRLARVRRMVDALFAGLFGPPFARVAREAPDVVAFDVTRCPLAAYLAARGVPELTSHAACALDHRMAATWGVGLVRTHTIAQGADSCDFRFVVLQRARAGAPVSG
jgi:ubiquinone biosynthesis protein